MICYEIFTISVFNILYYRFFFFFLTILSQMNSGKKGEYIEYWKQVVDSFECLSN